MEAPIKGQWYKEMPYDSGAWYVVPEYNDEVIYTADISPYAMHRELKQIRNGEW